MGELPKRDGGQKFLIWNREMTARRPATHGLASHVTASNLSPHGATASFSPCWESENPIHRFEDWKFHLSSPFVQEHRARLSRSGPGFEKVTIRLMFTVQLWWRLSLTTNPTFSSCSVFFPHCSVCIWLPLRQTYASLVPFFFLAPKKDTSRERKDASTVPASTSRDGVIRPRQEEPRQVSLLRIPSSSFLSSFASTTKKLAACRGAQRADPVCVHLRMSGRIQPHHHQQ